MSLYDLSEEERGLMGKSGFEFYEKNFKLENCIDNLELILAKK